MHITKTVLIPPTIGASLQPILGKLAAAVLLGADFTYMAAAINKADCGVSGVTPIKGYLATDASQFTAFLVPNAVFEGTAQAMGITVTQLIANFTAAQWRNIWLNHLVAGTNNLASMTNGSQLTTLLDANAKLVVTDNANAPQGKVLTTTGGTTGMGGTIGAAIVVKDISASNGVAHVVAKILIPN
ncbi:MAG TPA: fasciclin domain-containing protein, partial [Chryseosolibacter sp.]|nr:fasciclin domain-containing protein [Chryseosolibacter sp.]